MITVKLYGSLGWEDPAQEGQGQQGQGQEGGSREAVLPHFPGLRARDVLASLRIPPGRCALVVANGRVVELDQVIEDGAVLLLFPPLSGGRALVAPRLREALGLAYWRAYLLPGWTQVDPWPGVGI